MVRGTTNPTPCCHLANDTDLLTQRQSSALWPVITNKLTFDPPTRLPEMTLNLTRSSHGHSTPSLKISCKSVQPFSRNVADKETKKQRKKEIARKQYPSPYRGRGNNNNNIYFANKIRNINKIYKPIQRLAARRADAQKRWPPVWRTKLIDMLHHVKNCARVACNNKQ